MSISRFAAVSAPRNRAGGRWCGRGESNPHRSCDLTDFRTSYGFRRRTAIGPKYQSGLFVVWTIPSPCPLRISIRRRFRRCPSSLYTFRVDRRSIRLGSGLPGKGFPEFEQFCIDGFPHEHSVLSFKSVASTSFATPAASPDVHSHRAPERQERIIDAPAPDSPRSRSHVKACAHFLARLEIRNPFGGYINCITSPRVTTKARFASARRKGSETAKFYSTAFCQSLCYRFEEFGDDLFHFLRRKIGIVPRKQLN